MTQHREQQGPPVRPYESCIAGARTVSGTSIGVGGGAISTISYEFLRLAGGSEHFSRTGPTTPTVPSAMSRPEDFAASSVKSSV
jgi:hypothetical protein